MKTLYIIAVLLGFSQLSIAQEEAEACMPPSKKAVKYIKAALASSDGRAAASNFNLAMEEDDENATVYYELAMYTYQNGLDYYESNPNPSLGDRSFNKAKAMFEKTIELCEDYHANCTYYLGVICYTQKDVPAAVEWFKKFKKFQHGDTDRYPDDFTKKMSDVDEVLGDLEKDAKLQTEKVPFLPKIVTNVSTSDDEYFPMITPDNEFMFYTRKLDIGNQGVVSTRIVEQFTSSRRTEINADFDAGDALPMPFNTGDFRSYGAATLSVDNKEMIFCGCKDIVVSGQKYVNCDLYTSTFMNSKTHGLSYEWSEPVNMGEGINGQGRWDAQPSLSADGNTLYYTINGPKTQNNDIYVSERTEDGTWGKSRSFDVINTAGKDKSPFLHQDSETLYFVSECSKDRPGIGGLDIFYIRRVNGVWAEPKNIGYPINTQDDELGLFVSIDGEIAYYSSHVGGNWNIYSFPLYEEARPQAVVILKGELTDDDGEPMGDAMIELVYEGSDEITKVKVNGDDGRFAIIVKKDAPGDVLITLKKDDHAFDAVVVTKEEIASNTTVRKKDLKVRELSLGSSYTLDDILYNTASSTMRGDSKFILKGFARYLKINPKLTVIIQGHTDDEGESARNLKLSTDRAKGVMDYLISLGVDASRLKSKGYGETQFKVENNSAANRAINRRTDFVIQGM
ncbi:MAG: outer membrane protein OmpA-like peptidoglycan-associated protein [Flavobacteriaceae bacterium]|jgi:outer membrane protein OmpA-like peptidoglycan-associated protein/tetratricopeptide (TPR) repeat protein